MIYEPCLILRPENLTIAESARIDSFTKLECGEALVIGAHTHVSSFCHLGIGGGRLIIGAHVAIASGAKLLSGSNTMRGVSMSAASPPELQAIERKETIVEDYAFIGVNAIIMPGVRLGRGCVVGAGAVVTKDVSAGSIVVGVPGKVVGRRIFYERDDL